MGKPSRRGEETGSLDLKEPRVIVKEKVEEKWEERQWKRRNNFGISEKHDWERSITQRKKCTE